MTVAEYNDALKRIEARVHAARASGASKKDAENLRHELEFHLMIDHRLGGDFPRDRRESLAAIHRAFRNDLKAAIGRHVRDETTLEVHAVAVNALVEHSIDEYSRVLSADELEAFVGSGLDSQGVPGGVVSGGLCPP